MKGHIVHSEEVRKRNGKIQFQIKLPSTINRITGMLVAIDLKDSQTKASDYATEGSEFKGSIWLRIAEKRDVFYAGEVFDNRGKISRFFRKPEFGFIHKENYWISGKRPELFHVDVPVENTMIEGYFEDASSEHMVGYTLNIYLETNYD